LARITNNLFHFDFLANGKNESEKEEAKSKRNIFGSLFKKKKAKYDVKTVNSPKKEKK
jgi:hypothetical protein